MMHPSESSPRPSRSWVGWIATLVAFVAIGVSTYAMALVRSTMETQSKLLEDYEMLRKQVAQVNQEEEKTKDSLKTMTRELTASIAKPTIKIPKEETEDSTETLQQDLEFVVASLQTQYPRLPEALHVVAMMKAQTRKYGEAQELWQQCIRLAPKQELYYINLASVAMEQGNNELALNTLRQGVILGFDSFDISHHLSLALSNLGQFEEAVELIEKSLKKYPDAVAHWLLLGQGQLEMGNAIDAEKSFRKAMDLGATSASLYVGLGNACLRQGKQEEAKRFLETYAEIKKSDKLSGQERYQVLSMQEIKRTSVAIFTEAATIYFQQKDLLHTEQLLMRCVAIEPKSAPALRAVADLYFRTKMLAEERVVRERILELGSDRFSDYLDLAKVCALQKDRESAEATLKLAMTMFPQAIEPYAALSQIYLESGKLDAARWYAQQSIERQPSAEGFRFLASICQKMNDPQGAAEAQRLANQLEKKP